METEQKAPTELGSPAAKVEGQAVPVEPIASPTPPVDVDTLHKEIDRKEKEILRLQGVVQKQSISKNDVLALHKKIDEMQDWVADALDSQRSQAYGEEEAKPTRKTYREQLATQRAQAQPQAQNVSAPADPDAQMFWAYMTSQGLTFADKVVQDAIADDKNPQQALAFLKGKMDEKIQTTIAKQAREIANSLFEEKVKTYGLTAAGAGSPNAGGSGSYTKKQIADMSPEVFTAKHDDIIAAQRAGRIKD
jgi:hypothetical protein